MKTREDILNRISKRYIIDPETQCHIWQGSTNTCGYGIIRFNKRVVLVTRMILGIEDAGRKVFACHKCDTPLCINPEHLFKGTPSQNMKDMSDKKRSSRGRSLGMIRTYLERLDAE